MAIKIQGEFEANGTFPLADTTQIKGGLLQVANFVDLQTYMNVQRLSVGQLAVTTTDGKAFVLTTVGNPPTTMHIWSELITGVGITQDQKNALDNAGNTLNTANPVYDTTTANSALSLKVNTSTTVNGHPLSNNVTITQSDVGLGNVTNNAQVKQSERASLTSISDKITVVNGNSAVIGSGTSISMTNERQLVHSIGSEIITGNKYFVDGIEFGKSQDLMFFASWLNSIDAEFALNSTVATSVGGANISNAWLDLGHNDTRHLKFLAFNIPDQSQVGVITSDFDIIPRYSGIPSSIIVLFGIYSGSNANKVRLEHNVDGDMLLFLYDDEGTLIYDDIIILGNWMPIAETKYSFKLAIDYTNHIVTLYVNDQLLGQITDLPTAVVTNSWSSLWIGQNAENPTYLSNALYANFKLTRKIIGFNDQDKTLFNGNVKLARYKATSGTTFLKTDTAGDVQTEQLTISGTNTGDETNATIKAKLGAVSITNDGYYLATDYVKTLPIIQNYGTPSTGDTLVFNGNHFVSQKPQTTSGSIVVFYFAPTVRHQITTENGLLVRSLDISPVTEMPTTDSVVVSQSDNYKPIAAYKSAEIVSTVFAGGRWEFALQLNVDNLSEATKQSSVITSGFNCFEQFATVNITGTGTTRTVTIVSGGVFVETDYNLSIELTSFVETFKGLYEIVGYTSPTVILIKTPSGYINETNIIIKFWRNFYAQVSEAIKSTIPTVYWHIVASERIVNPSYNFFGVIVFGVTNYISSSVTVSLDFGTKDASYVSSPLVYDHNNLTGIQGGDATYKGHISSAEQTKLTNLPASFVSSFGPAGSPRTGAVTTQNGDYTASQVGAEPASANLTNLAGLTYVSPANVRMTGDNTFALDTTSYLPATITNASPDQIIRRVGSSWVNSYPQVITANTGAIAVPAITIVNNIAKQIAIASNGYVLYATSDFTGNSRIYTISGNIYLLNGVNYVYADYNGGNPIIATTATLSVINGSSNALIAEIFTDGIAVYPYNFYINNISTCYSSMNNLSSRLLNMDRFKIQSGLVLATTGSAITLTPGAVWDGVKYITMDAYNSSVAGQNNNYVWYYINSSWTYITNITGIYTSSYQNTTSSANLTTGKYAINWIFKDVQINIQTGLQQERLHIFLGRGDYTLDQALVAQVSELYNTTPVMPSYITGRAIFVGKIIALANATVATKVVTNCRVGNYYDNTMKGQGLITDPYGVDTGNLYKETQLTDTANIAWDLSNNMRAFVTLGGNRNLSAPTNGVDGNGYRLRITQGATPYGLTFDASIKLKNGVTPTLSNTVGATDFLYFEQSGGVVYLFSIQRFP